jgi:ATP-binding cassette subfamily B protein/subfamily B ATP-binding cassette protein MsbA
VRGGTACENLFRTFDVEPTITAPADRQAAPVHDRTIQFEHVSFAYYPRQPVLRDINLEVPFGQTVAIVGGNGSGKTTLINLLARFYDPGEGHIRIDGVDLRAMSPKAVRRHMSWVTQDATLFRGTVRENIAYGKPRATEAEILAAAEMAHVADFLDRLPHGLESDVGDNGQRLSAGQRQRVALARAVVANPRILILDEATSQMDGHTETLIHDSLKEFLAGRTTILITHRLSSLRLADRVIVLDKGRIVSDSTPTVAAGQSAEFQSLFAKSA